MAIQTPTPDDVRARVETDWTDSAIEGLLDEAQDAINDRIGPVADPDNPITLDMPGLRRKLDLWRPVDTTHAVEIVEFVTAQPADVEFAVDVEDWWPDVGETDTTLVDDDWRAWNGGRTLERLYTGTHPRVFWGSRIQITYVPVDDSKRRNEVAVKLAILSLNYEGVIERTVGDVRTTYDMRSASGGGSPLVYQDERERLLESLRPRRGIALR